jgi:hypothetical protein
VKIGIKGIALAAGTALSAALIGTAPAALADPVAPVPPLPPPTDVPAQPVVSAAAAAPPTEVPHLSSPENLPPGTSAVPVGPPQGRGMSYLRELWHAIQTQEVSGSDALLLLTQRPLNPNATPPPGLAPGPQPPLPADPPAPPPAPAPLPAP